MCPSTPLIFVMHFQVSRRCQYTSTFAYDSLKIKFTWSKIHKSDVYYPRSLGRRIYLKNPYPHQNTECYPAPRKFSHVPAQSLLVHIPAPTAMNLISRMRDQSASITASYVWAHIVCTLSLASFTQHNDIYPCFMCISNSFHRTRM